MVVVVVCKPILVFSLSLSRAKQYLRFSYFHLHGSHKKSMFLGTTSLYRNKIDNVAKFFEEKYSDQRNIDYMIYNLCSEMEYDHRKFHGNVKRFEVRIFK